jgi:hypothetical protein
MHQGRRNLLKVGGSQALRGTFPLKKGISKIFPGNVDDGGTGSSQKNFPDIPKKFAGYITFFPKYEKKFPDIPKKFYDISYFSRKLKKISANNIDSSFLKCPLAKKCYHNDIFHERKGHFAPGKRALC